MAFDVTEGGKVLGLCTWLKYLAGPERDLGTNGLLANQIAEISHDRIHFPFYWQTSSSLSNQFEVFNYYPCFPPETGLMG